MYSGETVFCECCCPCSSLSCFPAVDRAWASASSPPPPGRAPAADELICHQAHQQQLDHLQHQLAAQT
jgi:hypothetical protein